MTISAIPYQYRDASNYKVGGTIYVDGVIEKENISLIREKLDGGDGFIPFDLHLDIEEIQEKLTSFPSEDDHVFHELEIDGLSLMTSAPEGVTVIPLEDFLASWEKIASCDAWDVAAAVERLGLEKSIETETQA